MLSRSWIAPFALATIIACEPSQQTEQPADTRLSGPDDPDAEYPPGCAELGPSSCAGPCQRGEASACLHLAQGYLVGVGVPRDPPRALGLMRKSCELGLGRGCGYLAAAIAPEDANEARALATKGCEHGYGGACVWLVAHHVATGTPPDWRAAAPWLERGCASGHGKACLVWGDLLRTGQGVAQDDAAAKLAYRTSCDAGDEHGCELVEGTPTPPILHQLSASDPPQDELRRTRQHGRFRVSVQLCVVPDGSTRVDAVEGATGQLADVVRTTVSAWRWAPTGASEPTCTRISFDINLG